MAKLTYRSDRNKLLFIADVGPVGSVSFWDPERWEAGLVHPPAALAEPALAGHLVPHKREYHFIDLDQWVLPMKEDI